MVILQFHRGTIPRLHGEPEDPANEPVVTPRASARPEGAELHGAKRNAKQRKRAGLSGGGTGPERSPNEKPLMAPGSLQC